MNDVMLARNLRLVAGFGGLILLTGLLLYWLRSKPFVSGYEWYFSPIPPLGVAAYVFVLNLLKKHTAGLPDPGWVAKQVVLGAGVAALVFAVFCCGLLAATYLLERGRPHAQAPLTGGADQSAGRR